MSTDIRRKEQILEWVGPAITSSKDEENSHPPSLFLQQVGESALEMGLTVNNSNNDSQRVAQKPSELKRSQLIVTPGAVHVPGVGASPRSNEVDESSTNGDDPQALEEAVVVTATLAPSENYLQSNTSSQQDETPEGLSRSPEESKDNKDNPNLQDVSVVRKCWRNWGLLILVFLLVMGAAIGVVLVLLKDDSNSTSIETQNNPPITGSGTGSDDDGSDAEVDLTLSAGLTPEEEIEVRSTCPGIQFWGATEPLLTHCPIDANNCDTSQTGCAELDFEESVIFNGNRNSVIYQQRQPTGFAVRACSGGALLPLPTILVRSTKMGAIQVASVILLLLKIELSIKFLRKRRCSVAPIPGIGSYY